MGMGSQINRMVQNQRPATPQPIGGKGGGIQRMVDNAPRNPVQPGTPSRPDIFVRPTGAAPISPFEFQPAAQPGTLNPMGDTFVRPINPAMDGSSIAPQPIGGKGGGIAGMPPGMMPTPDQQVNMMDRFRSSLGGTPQPQMPPPGMPQQQMPPGYSQPLFDKQQRLNEQIAKFQQKQFGDLNPQNIDQYRQAVSDKFGGRMERLAAMQPTPTQAPMQTQAPVSGLGALAQNPAYRNLLG